MKTNVSEEIKVSFNRLQEEYIYEKSEKEKELEEVENSHRCEVEEMHDKYKEEMDKCKLLKNYHCYSFKKIDKT